MLYKLLRPILFKMDPETAHEFSLQSLKKLQQLGFIKNCVKSSPRTVMEIKFPNPIGLAAGLDKNGEYIDALAALGFGFIEIGTVTPRPQPGNPKPRLFRIPQAEALINRLGFNSKGVDYLVDQVKQAKFSGVLGINIGKNFDTPLEKAADDYLFCMQRVYLYASYITVNISSPNTPGLRNLQSQEYLDSLLSNLKQQQQQLAKQHHKYVPLTIKISPDLTQEELQAMVSCLLKHEIDGIIATNTTISREGAENLPFATEQGGLSGKPLFEKSTEVVQQLASLVQGKIPIIAVGGIMNADDAQKKFQAGASLVQIYTGFIYRGPELICDISNAMRNMAGSNML